MRKKPCPTGATPRLLSAEEAGRTLAARLAPTVDRIRGRLTTFGLRPYQVFLVWTKWSGNERGDGREKIMLRVPILPIPKVEDLTSVSFQLYSGGVLPVGSIRVTEISATLAQDYLMGLVLPADVEANKASIIQGKGYYDPTKASLKAEEVVDPYEFFWEVVEDGRSNEGRKPRRTRYRILAEPYRRPENMDWAVMLERVSQDMERDGQPSTAVRTATCEDD